MTAAEHSAAVDNADVVAADLTGETNWWDLNDMFKGFLGAASTIGYSSAWLPKPIWVRMLKRIQRLTTDLKMCTSFSARVRIARQFAVDVKSAFLEHKHHVMAAFMLGCLTMAWPPARYFMAAWAMTGLFGIAVHAIRALSLKAQRNSRFARFILRAFNKPLAVLETWIRRSRNVIDAVKNGIFYKSAQAVDFLWKAIKNLGPIVQPHVQSVIFKAKNAFQGFLGWITGSIQVQPA